mgnify:CR=1 FL=1
MIVAAKSGYRPDFVAVALRAGSVNTITLMLIAQAVSVEAMIVTATRGERRVEDTPRQVAKGSCECGAYTKKAVACRHGPPTIAERYGYGRTVTLSRASLVWASKPSLVAAPVSRSME